MGEFERPMSLDRGAADPIARLLFDQSVMSTCLVDRDLRIVAVNGPWSDGLREKPENLVGRLLTEVAPWISERWLAYYVNALAGECISVQEEKLTLPTGVIYCTMQLMPWRVDGKIMGVMCFAQDVTGYVSARASSEAFERRLEVALDIFGAAVCEVDRCAHHDLARRSRRHLWPCAHHIRFKSR